MIGPGSPDILGATPDAEGVNFAVWSEAAERIELCLFDEADRERRLVLPERTGAIRHGHVAGLRPGARYGFRAYGDWAPEAGLRFNPAKLLIDPYAREIERIGPPHEALLGHDPQEPSRPSTVDSAPYAPRCVVTAPPAPLSPGPRRPWSETVIYEAHVKALTKRFPGLPPEIAGTFEGIAHPAFTAHLRALGVTALELLPVQAWPDDDFIVERGLSNHWGYNTLGYFAPAPRFLGPSGAEGFRAMATALHEAGIELILDIVFNHTAEGDERGPTLSFRGLDNAGYYRMETGGAYVNDTGCGNTVDLSRPHVVRLALDAMRHWAAMGADGFRFDLAPVLGRLPDGYSPEAPFFAALLADPVLSRLKLIAEPWDIGPGGYRLGEFPSPFAEWNDRFRDDARRFWRGDETAAQALADRLLGSAGLFDRNGRRPFASVNFITAHDGMTLADLTSFAAKRNEANGEANRDGHGHDFSDNCGAEGETGDPAILAARALRRRSLLATLLLSQGVPMLLAGDEIGHSQGGNNNAWCQDNETTWLDWESADAGLLAFARRLVACRAAHPALRQGRFLHGEARADGAPEVEWFALEGGAPDWENPEMPGFALLIRGAAGGPEPGEEMLIAVNRGAPARLALPGGEWTLGFDTGAPEAPEAAVSGAWPLASGAVAAFHRSRG